MDKELKKEYTKIFIENLKLTCIKDLKDTYDIIIKHDIREDRFERCVGIIMLWYFLYMLNDDSFYKLSKLMQQIINNKICSVYYGTESYYESYFNQKNHIYGISEYLSKDYYDKCIKECDFNIFNNIVDKIIKNNNLDEDGILKLIKNEIIFLSDTKTIYI